MWRRSRRAGADRMSTGDATLTDAAAVTRWGDRAERGQAAALLAGAARHLRLPDHLRRLLPGSPLRDGGDVAEDDAGDPPRPPLQPARQTWTFQPWIDAWLHACTGRDCFGLQSRLPELGEDHGAERDHLDHYRLDQRLRAVVLALQGRQHLLRPARVRRLRALPGGDLPADHRPRGRPAVLDAGRASSSSTPFSACRS